MAGGTLHARQAATCPDSIDQEASPQVRRSIGPSQWNPDLQAEARWNDLSGLKAQHCWKTVGIDSNRVADCSE